jgi:hypothetical protein
MNEILKELIKLAIDLTGCRDFLLFWESDPSEIRLVLPVVLLLVAVIISYHA